MPSSKAATSRRILVVKSAGGLEGSAFDHLCNGLLGRAAAGARLAPSPSDLIWLEMLHSSADTAFVWKGEGALPWDRVRQVSGIDVEVFADDSVGDADFASGQRVFKSLARWEWTS